MPEENRVIDKIVGADGNAQRFHQGKHPQGGIPAELSEEEEQSLKIHTASIHAPEARPRFGYDDEGEPIEAGPEGLIVTDPVTGEVAPLSEESIARSEQVRAWREDREERGLTGGTPPAADARPARRRGTSSSAGAPPPPPPPPPPAAPTTDRPRRSSE